MAEVIIVISDQDSVKARQAGPGDSAGSGRRTQEVCGGGRGAVEISARRSPELN